MCLPSAGTPLTYRGANQLKFYVYRSECAPTSKPWLPTNTWLDLQQRTVEDTNASKIQRV
jgi:hypothetical protein